MKQTTLNGLIITKIHFNIKDIKVEEINDYKEILPICFTPIDRESLRQPWILERKYTDEELYGMSEDMLNNTIMNYPSFIIEYNPNINSIDLKNKVKRKILERI